MFPVWKRKLAQYIFMTGEWISEVMFNGVKTWRKKKVKKKTKQKNNLKIGIQFFIKSLVKTKQKNKP